MTTATCRLTAPERRRGLRWGIVSGVLWSIGNGCTTGALVTYLAQDLGAGGFDLAVLTAWQALVGTARLFAPSVIRRLGGLKPAAIVLLLISYGLLSAVPIVASEGLAIRTRLIVFISILCAHQFFEHLGTVAVLSWLADLTPRRLRGRYFATRQRWLLIALIPTSVAAALLADHWGPMRASASAGVVLGCVMVLTTGAVFLLLSVAALWPIPAVEKIIAHTVSVPDCSVLRDRNFVRLLAYGCWISFANGISQSPSSIYPKGILKLGLTPMILLPLGMRLGQIALAPTVGRLSDRWGNKPIILVSQVCVAFGPFFFLLATPAQPYWLIGTYVVWSAFVGLNVCLPNLMFRLAPAGQIARYTAIYFGLTGLMFGLSTLGAGWLLDHLGNQSFRIGLGSFGKFQVLFAAGWLMRLASVPLIARLREPEAWTWRQIMQRRSQPGL
jgi:MFS family permease